MHSLLSLLHLSASMLRPKRRQLKPKRGPNLLRPRKQQVEKRCHLLRASPLLSPSPWRQLNPKRRHLLSPRRWQMPKLRRPQRVSDHLIVDIVFFRKYTCLAVIAKYDCITIHHTRSFQGYGCQSWEDVHAAFIQGWVIIWLLILYSSENIRTLPW